MYCLLGGAWVCCVGVVGFRRCPEILQNGNVFLHTVVGCTMQHASFFHSEARALTPFPCQLRLEL